MRSRPFSYAGGSFPAPAAPARRSCGRRRCTVVVAFTPGLPGHTATLAVAYDDGTGPAIATRPLSGSGTNAPVLRCRTSTSPTSAAGWDFGTAGSRLATHEFVVINTGGAPAGAISAPAIGAGFGYVGGNYPGQGGSCSTSLAAGAVHRQRRVPAGGARSRHRDRALAYQDATASPFTAARVVRGVGTTVGLIEIRQRQSRTGAAQRLRRVGLGSSSDRVFTVRNIGGGPVSAMSFAALAPPFASPGGDLRDSLAAGATCTVDILFTPTGRAILWRCR